MFLTLHQYGWIQPATLASVAAPRQIKRSVHCSPPLIFVYGACLRFPKIKFYISSLAHRVALAQNSFSLFSLFCSFFIPFPLFYCFPWPFPFSLYVPYSTFMLYFLSLLIYRNEGTWFCSLMSNLCCICKSKLWFSSNHNALYGHSEAACTADFQFIFTMFSPFNCPEQNVIRACWNEARWRRQLGYGALTSSHTQFLCSRVYLVSFESIFLLWWIRVKKCAATSALPALCSLSLCHFFVKYTNAEGTSHVCIADLAWIPNESRYKRELPVM